MLNLSCYAQLITIMQFIAANSESCFGQVLLVVQVSSMLTSQSDYLEVPQIIERSLEECKALIGKF